MIDLDTMSRVLHVPKSTLRYWEAEGLIHSVRGDNNYRYYNERDTIEVGDVILYRKLGVGVKRISELRHMEDEQAESFFIGTMADIDAQIAKLEEAKRAVSANLALLERYHALLDGGCRIVQGAQIGMESEIVRFDVNDAKSMACWLAHPYDARYVLVFDGLDDVDPHDGWILEGDELSHDVLLKPPHADDLYLQGALLCDALDVKKNNLNVFRTYMMKNKLKGEHMIARYLMNGYDAEQGRELARYELFIKLA